MSSLVCLKAAALTFKSFFQNTDVNGKSKPSTDSLDLLIFTPVSSVPSTATLLSCSATKAAAQLGRVSASRLGKFEKSVSIATS